MKTLHQLLRRLDSSNPFGPDPVDLAGRPADFRRTVNAQAYVEKSSNGDGRYSSPGDCDYSVGGTSSCTEDDEGGTILVLPQPLAAT